MDLRAAERLQSVNDFDSLLPYLRDELDWPVEDYGFDDLTFQYTAQELGLDDRSAAKVTAIRRLRPLDDEQPWGIFFLELEPKRLPVVALRRVLSKMTLKKRASSNRSDSPAWHADDILFISRTGESDERHLTFAHFATNPEKADLPVLKVLGWDASDTALRVDHVAEVLKEKLVWPDDPTDSEKWRKDWRGAFTQRHGARVSTAKEMASQLAQLARRIRGAIREVLAVESENGPLTKIMDAFRESLVHDLDPEQFADTYAQTITYGLLSARITDPSKNTLDDLASHMQTNPFLKELMESFINVGGRKKSHTGVGLDFDELGVSDVVELLDNANMEAVVRDFGRHNQQEDPVIHFFEGFLQEYDRSIRKDRGVFYTPKPVVSFIVRSVDELLRTEFGLEDGLADTTTWGEMAGRIDDLKIPEGATADQAFVQILDPATGTGTFLVEVIDLIHKTMTAKWQAEGHGKKKIQELWKAYVPERLLPRLHGYELMMAPYAIAHMKIGLKLYETGYRFESDERARVYLTNALEPAQDFSGTLAFAIPALAREAEAVNAIKRDQRFTVVIGNPPYSIRSGNLTPAARSLIEPFKTIRGERLSEKGALQLEKNLNDDYVKFFGLLLQLIRRTDCGVGSYISNHGFMDNRTFRGFRWNLLDCFSSIRLVDLHGNTKRREPAPIGRKNENVFDIQQGVAISLMIRHGGASSCEEVEILDEWGTREEKYRSLAESKGRYLTATCIEPQYSFQIVNESFRAEYQAFESLGEAMPLNSTGIKTHRDAFVIDFDAIELRKRIEDFRGDARDEEISEKYGLRDTHGWRLRPARKKVQSRQDWEQDFQKCLYRPFDVREIYFSADLVELPRLDCMQHLAGGGNLALLATRQVTSTGFNHVLVTRLVNEMKTCSHDRGTNCFPLLLAPPDGTLGFSEQPNLSGRFLARLADLLGKVAPAGATDLPDWALPTRILSYIYGALHSPSYRSRYAEFLKIDFPRVPLPHRPSLFSEIADLGGQLTELHLLESPKLSDKRSRPAAFGGMHVEKASYSDETVWIDKAKTRGFKGVPEEVWNFHIGGYQVCEKWLKDRQAKGGKNPHPGRVLTDEDIEHYQKIVVALSETIRIMAEIDEVIEAHGGWPGAFQTGDAGDEPVSDVVYAEADDGASQLDMVAEPKDG